MASLSVLTSGHQDKGAVIAASIDPSFVVPPEHTPFQAAALSAFSAISTDLSIPVIDLAPLHMESHIDAPVLQALVAQVALACSEWGFFQIINHGVPHTIIQNLKDEAKAFFELPIEKKQELKRTYEKVLGYTDAELTRNLRDWKEAFDIAPRGSFQLPAHFDGDDNDVVAHPTQWPPFMPSLRNACKEYISSIEKLAFTLLELIAQSLGLPPCHFHEDFKSSTLNLLRLLHYPVCPVPELALGVNGHKDTDGFTILLQDEVGGLEVRSKDGQWISVKPNPQAFVINVGDAIQVYSNDKYRSVEHRALVNRKKDRYSFPFFFNPTLWVNLSPISELLNDKNPPRYRPFNWGKYIKRRKDSNYKDLGVKNLEISHYSLHA